MVEYPYHSQLSCQEYLRRNLDKFKKRREIAHIHIIIPKLQNKIPNWADFLIGIIKKRKERYN
jgi:hypothetical protein